MNTYTWRKTVGALTLVAALGSIALINGCTHTPKMDVRYTPLTHVQRLTDKDNPQTVVVGKFDDARAVKVLVQQVNVTAPFDPTLVHIYKHVPKDDITKLVRSAFVDAMLKSGFEVPMSDEQATNSLFFLSGRIVTYQMNTKSERNTIFATGDVAIEVTITPKTGLPVTFLTQGQSKSPEYKFSLNIQKVGPEVLDRALQECVKKFLEDERFRGLVKR